MMTCVDTETRSSSQTTTRPAEDKKPRKQPAYHVILLDDDDHTYEYVIGMLRKLFGFSTERAYQLACEVDETGRVILETTTRERAEFKRDQIHAFGRDWRIARCQGSMTAIVEPAPE
ncbi:MAG: ATP-dependent Clp protease adaptor ClpS [Planctomycetota bacterium]|nr:MAG: ATP-dependent Clp protease adaptor ClpS [Planctomycetota bacterium]